MEAAIAEIKPNIAKAFLHNMLIIGAIVALVIVLLFYLHYIVGLGIFVDVLNEIGIIISPAALLAYIIFFVLFFTVIILVLNYVSLGKVSYTLYPDKLTYGKSFLIMQLSDETIPYGNITKVSFERKSFLNTSKVIIDITGMKRSKLEIEFADNAEEIVRKLNELINEHRAKYYAQYTQNYRMQNIMDRI